MKFWFLHPASCTRKVLANKSTEDMGRKRVGGMDWETAWWGTWSSTSRLSELWESTCRWYPSIV